VVLNATFDPVENRWKALEASDMYRAQQFPENCYYLTAAPPAIGVPRSNLIRRSL
jgi:hypothetical protein